MTQGKLQGDRSRHFDFLRDPGHQGNANSGDPGIFDSPLNQPHGLMADGSTCGQKSDAYVGLLEFLSHLLSCPFSEGSRIGDEAHEPVIRLRKSTDNIDDFPLRGWCPRSERPHPTRLLNLLPLLFSGPLLKQENVIDQGK